MFILYTKCISIYKKYILMGGNSVIFLVNRNFRVALVKLFVSVQQIKPRKVFPYIFVKNLIFK